MILLRDFPLSDWGCLSHVACGFPPTSHHECSFPNLLRPDAIFGYNSLPHSTIPPLLFFTLLHFSHQYASVATFFVAFPRSVIRPDTVHHSFCSTPILMPRQLWSHYQSRTLRKFDIYDLVSPFHHPIFFSPPPARIPPHPMGSSPAFACEVCFSRTHRSPSKFTRP